MSVAMMALRSRVRKRNYVRFRSADPFPLTSLGVKPMSEVEHIWPMLKAWVMPLESQGLLAAGIRAVLQENSYGPAPLSKDSSCHAGA